MFRQVIMPRALDFGWTMKPLSSARTGLRQLRDSRDEPLFFINLHGCIVPRVLHWSRSDVNGAPIEGSAEWLNSARQSTLSRALARGTESRWAEHRLEDQS